MFAWLLPSHRRTAQRLNTLLLVAVWPALASFLAYLIWSDRPLPDSGIAFNILLMLHLLIANQGVSFLSDAAAKGIIGEVAQARIGVGLILHYAGMLIFMTGYAVLLVLLASGGGAMDRGQDLSKVVTLSGFSIALGGAGFVLVDWLRLWRAAPAAQPATHSRK